MSAGGYEGLASSYSAATLPNDSARARFSCRRFAGALPSLSVQLSRDGCGVSAASTSAANRSGVGRFEPRGCDADASRAGDAEPVPGEDAPAAAPGVRQPSHPRAPPGSRRSGRSCRANRCPDPRAPSGVPRGAACKWRRHAPGGRHRRAHSTSEPRAAAGGATPNPRRAGVDPRRAQRWWHHQSSGQDGGRVPATSTPNAGGPSAARPGSQSEWQRRSVISKA